MMSFEGKVLGVRDLGGIIFVKVLSDNEKVQLVCHKNDVDVDSFYRVKKIKINSFYRFSVVKRDNDLVIVDVLSTIEEVQSSFWTEEQIDILRAYSYLLVIMREYFSKHGYVEVRLPVIHYGQHKKDAFSLDFFRHPARLTSSNALFLNIYAVQLLKVFTIQKCFRIEPSHTSKHLAEFDMLEVAMLNADLECCMQQLENLIKYIVQVFSRSEFKKLMKVDVGLVVNTQFPVIEYKHIEEIYELKGKGLGKHEREIAERLPTFVVNYPKGIASWIAKPLDNQYTLSFNLVFPKIGEVVEGNEKQTDLSLLSKKVKTAKMEKQLCWYTEMMPYSSFPLSGFGLGVERLFMWLFGIKNIRRIHPFYRDTGFSEILKSDDGERK